MRSFGHDAAQNAEGDAIPNAPSAMNYWSLKLNMPEEAAARAELERLLKELAVKHGVEFTGEIGLADDAQEKKPQAILTVYNMTIPEVDKTRLYGTAKVTIEFEEKEPS